MPKGIYKRKPFSEIHKKNLGLVNKGKKRSLEVRKKMSISHKGKSSGMLGKHCSEERKRKISSTKKGQCKGDKNSNWQDGKSFEFYPIDWTDILRESIRKRDNYICQLCGIHQDELNNNRTRKLDCHHIDYNKNNLDPKNLITLCRNCHLKTNFNRNYWIKYFN